MQMMFLIRCTAELTIKSKIQHTEHIERGEHSSVDTDNIHHCAMGEGVCQYLVLREDTCKRRYASYRQCTDQHSNKRDRNFTFQPTHFTHILLFAHCMDYRACTKE